MGQKFSKKWVNFYQKKHQIIDTPLADSDDIRMTPNTFEAYVASYEMNSFSFMAAHLNNWQGYDAGLDNEWVKMGKNGVNLAGISYSDKVFDIGLWYYNISNASQEDIMSGADENGNNSFYADVSGHFDLSKDIFLHLAAQYLKQNELDGSGVEANIYGTMAQVVVNNFSFGLAYNLSTKGKSKTQF